MGGARGCLRVMALSLLLSSWLCAQSAPSPHGSIHVEPGQAQPPRVRWPRPITPCEVQYLAHRNTPLAEVFEPGRASRTAPPTWPDWNGTNKARQELMEQVRKLTAEELRNQNVAAALELFWKLKANLEKCRLLALGKAELQAQLARLDEAVTRELRAPRDRDELILKLSRLRTDELTLYAGLEQLNDQLALLIGWKSPKSPAFQPESSLHVVPEAIDPCQAVQVGLHERPDLRLLRTLENNIDSRTLPVVQRWMTTISPLLGSIQVKSLIELVLRGITVMPVDDPEVKDVRKQMQTVRELRERQARTEIQRQVEIVQLKYQNAVETQHRLEIQRTRLGAVQEKVDKELTSVAELSPIRLDLWQAEADMIQAAVDWELARIELCRVQGLLARTPSPPSSCGPVLAPVSVPLPVVEVIAPPAQVPAVGLPQPRSTPVPVTPVRTLPPPGQFPPAFVPSASSSVAEGPVSGPTGTLPPRP